MILSILATLNLAIIASIKAIINYSDFFLKKLNLK